MYKLKKISVFTSFLALWLTSYLSDDNQVFLGFTLIFFFGILHGANDLVLISRIKSDGKSTFKRILLGYISIIAIFVTLFTKFPDIALLMFIMVSSYHFGEQQWHWIFKDEKGIAIKIFQALYGLLLLHLLFFFNLKKVIEIIYKITKVSIDENSIILALFTTMLLFAFSTIFIMMNSKKLIVHIIEEFFYLIILCLIFKSSSLIWSFTVYFVFWHSLPSLHDQITFLYGKFTFDNFKKYFKSAFIYWIISLIGIVLLFLFTKDWLFFDALFFSFLAAITFPHTLVIIKMYEE